MSDDVILLAGTANPELAANVAQELGAGKNVCAVERFPDGEVGVQILEPVRRKDVFILQPTSPPVNEHLVELLALVDACRRAAAGHITAVLPYFGYARSDKRHGRREPVAASMVAACLQAVGVDHVVTVDLHSPQIEGFFQVPLDNLTAVPALCAALTGRLPGEPVIVAPDAGAVKLATQYARRLGARVVVTHKERRSGTETEVTHVVGEVSDHSCLIVDDMISTGGTIARCAEALRAAGARPEIMVGATHGLFTGDAREKLAAAGVREILVTDTVAPERGEWPERAVVPVAPLLAAAIRRFVLHGSISDLF